MAIPQDRQSAKELVERITKEHGYVSDEKLRHLDPALRREIQEALLKKDHMIGLSVITLSKNLYTSKARFLFELLQNADDNSYTKAKELGAEPFVSFRVYPNQIILECNEDGFNHENLVAICSIGKSSKTGAQGYIGEKGIGFKSVFVAAWKVHIQSGAFSFFFTHKPGDSGMGMISPIWEDAGKELPESPLTRITLHLHETGDDDMVAKTRHTIKTQFDELQETFLLFMKNLSKINVTFHSELEEQTSAATYSVERPRPNFAVLSRAKVRGDEVSENEVNHYHVTTHEATNLAKNENRSYSEAEESSRAYSKSQVTLAFPLSATSVPIVRPQDLFVFLPVRSFGFTFLIQADFVTDAARQDIVKDSLRNLSLLDGIADAFMKAILQFCEDDTLRYQWMRYLPDKEANTWDTLWLSLIDRIANRMSNVPVLFGQTRPDIRYMHELLALKKDILDLNGKPLFDDIETDQIISQLYHKSDEKLLITYGLRNAEHHHLNRWLRMDLSRGLQSRMKALKMPDSWHTQVAKLLNYQFQMKLASRTAELRSMDLLPLQDGTWVSASSGPVYFANVGELDIPPDIGLPLISKDITNFHRKLLFTNLGVIAASVKLIRATILQMYQKGKDSLLLTTPMSKHHLEFLYLSDHLKRGKEDAYSNLAIFDRNCILRNPFEDVMYIMDNNPHGAFRVFQKIKAGPKDGNGAPGYASIFVDTEYFVNSPATPLGQTLTWREWFYSKLAVQRVVDIGKNVLSLEGMYLQKHRPDKFLGCVHLWIQNKKGTSPDQYEFLRNTEVLCQGGRQILLKDAYFPTEVLKKRVERFLGGNFFFPWLWIDRSKTPEVIPPEWETTMKALGVGTPSTDLDFALDLLKYLVEAFPSNTTPAIIARLFELYDHISAKQREAMNQDEAEARVREFFNERRSIFIPLPEDKCTWAFPKECVWKAPQEMKSKYALEYLYKTEKDIPDDPYLPKFFNHTLCVENGTWIIFVDELKALAASDCDDVDTITGIYAALDALKADVINPRRNGVRDMFETYALIYAPSDDHGTWHKASQCVWHKAAKLKGKVFLNDRYKQFEDLFVKHFGVKSVDLTMAVEELRGIGNKPSVTQQEVKELIWTVNDLLLSDSKQHPSPRDVATGRIFPIRRPDGNIVLESKVTEFFIADSEPLRSMFETQVNILDFSQADIVQLQPFLKWTRLQFKYLLSSTKEIISFHGGSAKRILNPERQILNRAHALLRIAAQFNSPRVQSKRALYEFLKKTELYETNGISSDFLLKGDVEYKAEGEITTLHIDESQECLKIYLPTNKDDQECHFANELPQRLFQWLMSDPVTHTSGVIQKDGVIAIESVLLAPLCTVARALKNSGIAEIDIANTDEEASQEFQSLVTEVGIVQEHSDVATLPASLRDIEDLDDGSSAFRPSVPLSSSPKTPWSVLPPVASSLAALEAEDRQYVTLLDKVIEAGRQHSLSEPGVCDRNIWQSILSAITRAPDWGLRDLSKSERDYKVGAAGELYVFELLSHITQPRKLPGFSSDNWQSNIRRYVTVHPEYATMGPWEGTETTDLVYTDCDGALTAYLMARHDLEKEKWQNKRPQYFIEVKTTTSSCDTPFFVSKAQYDRMKENTGSTETVYAIFRVFNLGRDDMNMKVYLDPAALRKKHRLAFTTESWSVIPTSG